MVLEPVSGIKAGEHRGVAAGTVLGTREVQASDRSWGLLWVPEQLWGPGLSPYTCVASGACRRHVHGVGGL